MLSRMGLFICPDCGDKVVSFAQHVCAKSRGGVENGPPRKQQKRQEQETRELGSATVQRQASPSGPREFRKPLAKDADKTLMATKPWLDEGMSRASWYRRRKGQKK
jgi:hypothetical protein